MDIKDTLSLAAEALSECGADFALIGGFALAAHGVVRATQDIDFLVDGKKKSEVHAALQQKGFKLDHRTDEVMHFSGKGQLDLLFANRELSQKMIQNAVKINNFPVPVVRVEDLIGLKIQAYKNEQRRELRDKADIQALMESNAKINYGLVKQYADLFGEWRFIQSLRDML
jgi:DNA repair ATPase RecN